MATASHEPPSQRRAATRGGRGERQGEGERGRERGREGERGGGRVGEGGRSTWCPPCICEGCMWP
eukprot:97702-Rhodomonas_salina.2